MTEPALQMDKHWIGYCMYSIQYSTDKELKVVCITDHWDLKIKAVQSSSYESNTKPATTENFATGISY